MDQTVNIGAPMSRLAKYPAVTADEARNHVLGYVDFARDRLGADIPAGCRVLDFGCGLGEHVGALLDLGYDAHGTDIVEYWGRDHDQHWTEGDRPAARVAERLRLIGSSPYRLPFEDASFDFAFSQEVLEHVSDHGAAFAELARVLKPGAISVHRFPGPGGIIESHTRLPITALCRSTTYLKLCAMMGLRCWTQAGMTWRETVASNVEMLRYCYYPTKRRLREIAAEAGVSISFHERDEMAYRDGGRFAAILNAARRAGMDQMLLRAVSPALQRFMVLRRA